MVEFGEQSVLRHQVHAGKARGTLAAPLQPLGRDLRLQFTQLLVAFERRLHGVFLRFRQGGRRPLLRRRTYAVVR